MFSHPALGPGLKFFPAFLFVLILEKLISRPGEGMVL